ncbi:MAG: RNA pseudouridine synthase [Muribaculaceae bacterium]|nr:RNA pseudouridine synthase [Muribaculaceae bacterium]
MASDKVHRFHCDVSDIELPEQFTYPMHYVPHKLCKIAAGEVMDYALKQEQWREELKEGKMLGVLVVKDIDNTLGYLAAYSGNLAHTGEHEYFVPHIYNLLKPQGMFRIEEERISAINHQIESLENSPHKKALQSLLDSTRQEHELIESELRRNMEDAKHARDARRKRDSLSPEQEEALIKESQHQKAELRRVKKRHRSITVHLEQQLNDLDATILELKAKRKAMSEELQKKLFKLFVIKNARGESCDVATIFERRLNRMPPGGTGECCAPKLLQYAYNNSLKPMCMAEFWVGQSPQGEVRHHGHYYPACRSKCLPLLEFMLQGLDVENDPLSTIPGIDEVKVIYEDQFLIVVDKPAGMLTVPGKDEQATSLLEAVCDMLPEGESALEVHRLDQATSGLVVFAKTHEAQRHLRQQFEERKVRKTYVALLDGTPPEEKGVIALPLRPDIDDRPRQVVDMENGKQAITEFRVLEHRNDKTLVEFTPLTGRTHQLRVHASHPQGLNCPISGDMLYGTASSRLFLHAQTLCFSHPITNEPMSFSSNK